MEKISPPYIEEQVKRMNEFQKSGKLHPFTCDGRPFIPDKYSAHMERSRVICPNEGILEATKDGWVCRCGMYFQDWAYKIMVE